MTTKTVSLDEAIKICRLAPTLVIGPTATNHLSWATTLAREVRSKFLELPLPETDCSIQILLDIVKQKASDRLPDILAFCKDRILELQPTRLATELATGRWSSIISLSPDLAFETAFGASFERTATQWTHTIIAHQSTNCPRQTTPVFKLLGNVLDHRPEHTLALGTSAYLRRRQNWPNLLRPLLDYTRDAPLVFVGTETSTEQVRDLATAILSGAPPHPSRFMYFTGDGTFDDPTLLSLLEDRTEVILVNGTAREFSHRTASIASADAFMSVPKNDAIVTIEPALKEHLSAFNGFLDLVPSGTDSSTDFHALRKPLCDSLFRSISHDWLPFLLDMALERSICSELEEAVLSKFQYLTHDSQPVLTVVGDASVGKTIVLKQLAVRLAKRHQIVCWVQKPPSDGIRKAFRKFCLMLAKSPAAVKLRNKRPLILFCDNPVSAGYSVSSLVDIATECELPTVFIVALRSSDVLSKEELGQPLFRERFNVAPVLDDEEMKAIPSFLLKAGIAATNSDAAVLTLNAKRDARDVLCSFWYMVPETRSAISISLQDEYCRLGGVTGAVGRHAAEARSEFGDHARNAYECVAVASSLDVGVPLEVLVRAVEMDVEEWRAMCINGKPVWGLLYDYQDSPTSDILFYTRNHVVTDVLLELLNVGSGHAGEFRILKRLVSACYIGTPQYRTFLVNLLVNRRKSLEAILTYEQGVDLFDLAVNIFPEPDKALQHHYGKWHKKWARHVEAENRFAKALDTPNYAYDEREEKDENVRTSMAANVVARFVKGDVAREAAIDTVKEHLKHASLPSRFDAHTQHVFANLMIKLANDKSSDNTDALSLTSFADALAIIEAALQAIGAQGKTRRSSYNQIEALLSLRASAFALLGNFSDAAEHAMEVYKNTGSQCGFEVLARKLLADATTKRSDGSAFKACDSYLEGIEEHIKNTGYHLGDRLLAVKVDLFIRWRLTRARGPVNWNDLRSWLTELIQSSRYRDDVVKRYYLAISLFHCGLYPLATSEFQWIRRNQPHTSLKRGIRNYLLGPEGFPRRLQGQLQTHGGRNYFFVPELDESISVDHVPAHLSSGATTHCYLGFELVGPKVFFDRPDEEACLIP